MAKQNTDATAEFDAREQLVWPPMELTSKTGPRPKFGKRSRRKMAFQRQEEATVSAMIAKPHLQRATSLPTKLENAPPTRKLFWFRPSPSSYYDGETDICNTQASGCGGYAGATDCFTLRLAEAPIGKKHSEFERGYLPVTLEEESDESDLIGLAFLPNDE